MCPLFFSKKADAVIQRQTKREKVWVPVPALTLGPCGRGKQMCFAVDQTLVQTRPPMLTACVILAMGKQLYGPSIEC